jgi:hypothetical protein
MFGKIFFFLQTSTFTNDKQIFSGSGSSGLLGNSPLSNDFSGTFSFLGCRFFKSSAVSLSSLGLCQVPLEHFLSSINQQHRAFS